MPHISRSVPPLIKGAVAFALSLAALWAIFFLLLQESISWPGLLILPLVIGAIAFDVARNRGPTALRRFFARQPMWLRVIFHFVLGALLFSSVLLLLGTEHLSWPVVLATSALVVFGSELARRDEADRTAGRQDARWSRQDKLMLGVGISGLVIYSVLLTAWGLPANIREWLILGFVYAFPVATLLFVLLRRRK
jgi:hypothetical protein